MEKIYQANTNQNKAGVAILILDRADFKARKNIRDKERHYIMIKESILSENTILNIYAPNNRVTDYMRKRLIKIARRNPLSLLETSISLYYKWTDLAGRTLKKTMKWI